MWIERDYCSPPLAMEREAVSDRFFDNIKVEVASSEEDGWSIIRDRQPFGPYQINFTKKCGKYIPLRHIL